jgi:hypothetical protein
MGAIPNWRAWYYLGKIPPDTSPSGITVMSHIVEIMVDQDFSVQPGQNDPRVIQRKNGEKTIG